MIKYLIGAILIVGALYGLIEAWPLLAGPSLSIESPVDNAAFDDGIVLVAGVAARAASVTVNRQPVLHEASGAFSTTLTFPRGSSILTFVATDRFGRSVSDTRTVYVPASSSTNP